MAKQSKAGASSGACRFCGQSVIVEDGAEMTAPQLEEAATMLCGCDEAIKYQQEKNRRTVAKQRINELFGEDAGEDCQNGAAVVPVHGHFLPAPDAFINRVVFQIVR